MYVSQPEVKPGCVLRRANFNVLERRGLVDGSQVQACKRNMNTFAFVGDLDRSPEVSCVYHSEEAENQVRVWGCWVGGMGWAVCMCMCVLWAAAGRQHASLPAWLHAGTAPLCCSCCVSLGPGLLQPGPPTPCFHHPHRHPLLRQFLRDPSKAAMGDGFQPRDLPPAPQ